MAVARQSVWDDLSCLEMSHQCQWPVPHSLHFAACNNTTDHALPNIVMVAMLPLTRRPTKLTIQILGFFCVAHTVLAAKSLSDKERKAIHSPDRKVCDDENVFCDLHSRVRRGHRTNVEMPFPIGHVLTSSSPERMFMRRKLNMFRVTTH